jgi:hypothetical protein
MQKVADVKLLVNIHMQRDVTMELRKLLLLGLDLMLRVEELLLVEAEVTLRVLVLQPLE